LVRAGRESNPFTVSVVDPGGAPKKDAPAIEFSGQVKLPENKDEG
jgi:hypothetical protein